MYINKLYLEGIFYAVFKTFIRKPHVSKQPFEVMETVMQNKIYFPEKPKGKST